MQNRYPYNYSQLETTPYMQEQYPSDQQVNYSNNPYPTNFEQQPVLVGVPVSSNNYTQPYPPVQNAFPLQGTNNQQQTHPYQAQIYQQAQVPHPYQYQNRDGAELYGTFNHGRNHHMNLVPQNKVGPSGSDNSFNSINNGYTQQKNDNSTTYPQIGSPMVSHDAQFEKLNAEMFAPVVYNPNLLYTISSREPQLALCKKCNKYVQTIVKYEVGVGTLISSGCLFVLGAIPCAFIPCCMKDLKDAVHYCPVCGDKLGVKKFIAN